MNQIKAMLRQTWWLWLGCFTAAVLMVVYISPFFLVLLPMLLVVCIYFSFVRFDGDGNPRDL